MAPTWRICDRATFAELRRNGRRARAGPLSLTWLGDSAGTSPPRVAYAIGRPVGPAVVRNRLRRRLRAAVTELAPDMVPGAYLVAASPRAAEASFVELRAHLAAVLRSTKGVSSLGLTQGMGVDAPDPGESTRPEIVGPSAPASPLWGSR